MLVLTGSPPLLGGFSEFADIQKAVRRSHQTSRNAHNQKARGLMHQIL